MPESQVRTAVIYCRTSTSQQRESETIKAQVERCRRILERHDLTPCPYGPNNDGWILDDGTTGTLLDARLFANFINDLEVGKVRPDFLIVYSLSRISRVDRVSKSLSKVQKSHADAARIQATLIGRGVRVIDEDGEIDPKSITFQVKAMLANEEFSLIRGRTMAGKEEKLSEGKFAKGGKAPFGYLQVPVNGHDRKAGWRLVPHPVHADQLRTILAWFIDGGYTGAARKATEAGIETPMARTSNRKNKARDWTPTRWSPVSVQHLVDNAKMYVSGELQMVFDGKPKVIKFEPLIDYATHAKVEQKVKAGTLKHRAKFLSTGFLVCTCGSNIYNRAFSRYHHTRCDTCKRSIREDDFDHRLHASLVCRLIQLQVAEKPSARTAEGDAERLREIHKRVDAVNAKIADLVDLLGDGLDRGVWKVRNEKLNTEKVALLGQADRIRIERETAAKREAHEQTLLERVSAVVSYLTDVPDLDEARALLGELLDGERLRVEWTTEDGKTVPLMTWPAWGSLPSLTVRMTERQWPQMLPDHAPGIVPPWDE